MKEFLILSPSKEMDWSQGSQSPIIDENAKKIIKSIQVMSEEELISFLKIDQDLGKKVYQAYQEIKKDKAKAAIDTYQGLAFRQIDKELAKSNFAIDHLLILSALYGPLSPLDPINPYRLDFSKGLEIEGESLKKLQKKNYTEKLKQSRIYNLASLEFSERIDKKQVKDWIDIDFYESYKKQKKTHSATSKKLRGQLANHILQEKSFSQETFRNFIYQDYKLNKASTEKSLIYSLED